MLTNDDLQAIGKIVESKIEEKVPPMLKGLEGRVETKINDLEARMNVKFDAVQEQLDGIENLMVTKYDLERWEVGLTERYDKRYVRQVKTP